MWSKNKSGENRPKGIIILSIVLFACAFFLLLFSAFLLMSFEKSKEKLVSIEQIPFSQNLNSGTSIGILGIIISLLFIFSAIGLIKKQNWARIFVLVFSFIGLLGAITNVIGGRMLSIINIFFFSLIIYYLLFQKNAREFFQKKYY